MKAAIFGLKHLKHAYYAMISSKILLESKKYGGRILVTPDQLNKANNAKQQVAFTNLNHSGTSYVQNAVEHVREENSINEEAAANMVKQIMQNKDNEEFEK